MDDFIFWTLPQTDEKDLDCNFYNIDTLAGMMMYCSKFPHHAERGIHISTEDEIEYAKKNRRNVIDYSKEGDERKRIAQDWLRRFMLRNGGD